MTRSIARRTTVAAWLCLVMPVSAQTPAARGATRTHLRLDGSWEVLPVKGLALQYPPAATGWQTEQVPHEASRYLNTVDGPYMPSPAALLNKAGTDFAQSDKLAAWFRRRFTVPAADLAGRVAVLVFHGAAFKTTTWLNGQELGTSVQCAVPFEYDVTRAVRAGDNELLVALAGREGIVEVAQRTYVTPCNGMMAGLWGSVELQLRPAVWVDDTFVRTSVKAKRIDLDVTVRNAGPTPRTVQVGATVIDTTSTPQCNLGPAPVTVPAGGQATVTIGRDWLAPQLWSPGTPVLYYVQTAVSADGALIDQTSTRFGFREFEIKGRDFLLNGTRIVLLRNSTLTCLGHRTAGYRVIRSELGRPYNCVRLHLGQNNEQELDACDELGMMAIPEAAFSWVDRYPSATKAVWLANTKEYYRRWLRLHRNRPSVIMWSMCNETYWDNRVPADLAVADELLAVVRQHDPTRPQQGDGEASWDGRLPTINIHYPEGEAGDVRRAYPNSGLVVPNDLWWLKPDGPNTGWRAQFKWDRPLMLGEYWMVEGPPEGQSSYAGDAVFDWQNWRYPSSPRAIADASQLATLQMATDYYRTMGVAALNPWAGNRELFMRAVDVRPMDHHPNFAAGQTTVRKTVVFNDTTEHPYQLHLQARLTIGDRAVWAQQINCHVAPGTFGKYDVPVACPAVVTVTPARLVVRLRYWAGGGYHELSRFEETIYLIPPARLSAADGTGLVLLDTNGRTTQALAKLGLPVTAVKAVTSDALAKARVLVVGEDTHTAPWADAIRAFAAAGGRVVVLRQDSSAPIARELPEADPQHTASMAWLRAPAHPLMAGLAEAQFRWWRPDHLVSRRTFHKPATGRFQVILDSGGRYGMQWSPLSEVRLGQGLFAITQLALADRVEQEPLAGELLARLVRHAQSYQATEPRPLRLLAGGNESLKRALAACSVVTRPGLAGEGPVLVDGSQALTPDDLRGLRGHLDRGGTVWLHRYDPDSLAKIASLFPFTPKLAEFDPSIQCGALRPAHPVVNGLGSFDFYWTRLDTGARADIFQAGQPTAKLGRYALEMPSVEAGEPLLAPALLVRVPCGQGAILFDTLWWEDAFGAESAKVSRLVSTLVTNLGGDVRLEREREYATFPVDLTPHANMGYWDTTEGDGQGGWTDQGRNDMRFFLINHSGRAGGEDGAPEVTREPWPETVRLAGRPFRLADPTRGLRKGVITLRGGPHCPTLPSEVKGIRVGRKADVLWFLHTACWAVQDKVHAEIGRYVIHYEDGSTVVMPLRYGLELQDWWDPAPLPASQVAWTGRNLMHAPIGIWVTPWDNPQPGKRIETIDLVGNLTPTQLVLLGITGGVQSGGVRERLAARWRLSEASNGSVPNQVPGGPPLVFAAKAPTPFSGEGHAGLTFGGGRALTGDGRKVAAFGQRAPFSLEMSVRVDGPPPGYMGGLFQCMVYQQAGFRLVYYQNLKLGVEIYPGGGKGAFLTTEAALQPGRFYRLRLQFDTDRAQLYLDGKLVGSVNAPPPLPCTSDILIGSASGQDYHLNGVIEELEIRHGAE